MTRSRSRRRYYASGKNAVAECMRSGQKMRYVDLVEDGHIPGLLVHPGWYEERHPQELPVDTSDAVALWRPAPELSVNSDEFRTRAEWDAWIVTQCPPNPESLRFEESTTLNVALVEGSYQFSVVDPVAFEIGVCVYVELDGGGWWIGKTRTRAQIPCFTVQVLNTLAGVASAGNQVFISPIGEGVVLLDVNWDINTASATIDPGDPL